MKIIITNIVSLNVGDAAILQGMIATLKERYGEHTKIVVYDGKAESAEQLYSWATFRQAIFYIPVRSWVHSILKWVGRGYKYDQFRLKRLSMAGICYRWQLGFLAGLFANRKERAAIQDYLSADLIISTGGTYLIENYDLKKNIADYLLSLKLGRRLGFYTQTIGELKTPYYLKNFRSIFPRSEFIFLRDEKSKANVMYNGNYDGENITIMPDAAFKLIDHQSPKNKKSSLKNIAISVRELKHFNEDLNEHFYSSLAQLCIQLISQDVNITFLSTCQGIPDYWTNDANTARKVIERIPDEYHACITLNTDFHQPLEIRDLYSGFDLVIATRMHAAILALCAGTPTLALAYEFKINELFQSLGMPELAISVEDINSKILLERVRKIEAETEAIRIKQQAAVSKLAKLTDLAIPSLPEPEEECGKINSQEGF